MPLFDSGTPLANVETNNTLGDLRVLANQLNTQAAGLASNNTFTGTLNTFTNGVSADTLQTTGAVSAPTVAANTGSFDVVQATGPVTAPNVTANTGNFTTLQTDTLQTTGPHRS